MAQLAAETLKINLLFLEDKKSRAFFVKIASFYARDIYSFRHSQLLMCATFIKSGIRDI